MKVMHKGKSMNDGFVATLSIGADIAVATVKQNVVFNDDITPACVLNEIYFNETALSGWNVKNKSFDTLSVSDVKNDGEFIKVSHNKTKFEFVDGKCDFLFLLFSSANPKIKFNFYFQERVSLG
jgi:hypothetical protein